MTKERSYRMSIRDINLVLTCVQKAKLICSGYNYECYTKNVGLRTYIANVMKAPVLTNVRNLLLNLPDTPKR